MNIFKRIKGFFKKAASSASMIMSTGFGSTKWTPKDYDNFAKETYMKNTIAFRCMDYLAKSVASVPYKLFRRVDEDERETVDDHPVNALLRRPNPKESWTFLMIKFMVYLLVSGNDFFQRVSPTGGPNGGIPRELYVLRPDKMKIHTNDDGDVDGYIYNQDQVFEVDPVTQQGDVYHIKLFNPTDDYWGLSITEPASREIDSSNEATEWNMKIMQNEGRPGLVVTVKGQLTTEQYDRLEKKLKDLYSGSANAGRSLIIQSEMETSATPYNWSPKELDWIESNREMARKICLAYGVPSMLLGIPGDNTYSNYQEARLAFWEETVFFYLELIKNELNNWLFMDKDQLFLDYVLDNIPALAEKRKIQWTRAKEATFLTINEKRELAGYEGVEGGDVILISATMIPLEAMASPDDEESDEEEAEKLRELIDQGFTEDEALELLGLPKMVCEWVPVEGKPFANEYSCRLKDPEQFDKFRRQNNAAKVNGKPIDFIFGIKAGKSQIQAIRYRKKFWTKSSAKSHCDSKDHISFE